jgi:hypothetical protein
MSIDEGRAGRPAGWYWARWNQPGSDPGPWTCCHTAESDANDVHLQWGPPCLGSPDAAERPAADVVKLALGVLFETLHGPVPMATVAALAEEVLRLADAPAPVERPAPPATWMAVNDALLEASNRSCMMSGSGGDYFAVPAIRVDTIRNMVVGILAAAERHAAAPVDDVDNPRTLHALIVRMGNETVRLRDALTRELLHRNGCYNIESIDAALGLPLRRRVRAKTGFVYCSDCRGVIDGPCDCMMHQDGIDMSGCEAHRDSGHVGRCKCDDPRSES